MKPNTLIWHQGLDNWKQANDVEELKEIFELNTKYLPPDSDTLLTDESADSIPDPQATTEGNYPPKKQKLFSRPFSFNGRIRRLEYVISVIVFIFFFLLIDELLLLKGPSKISFAYIPLFWFLWAQAAKRCHDIGLNGFWQFFPWYIIVLSLQGGQKETNKYGKNPKK